MKELFLKKYWEEDDILFYFYFNDNEAIKQIEINRKRIFLTSKESPINEESMLYDQSLEELEYEENEVITKEEFMNIWNCKNK